MAVMRSCLYIPGNSGKMIGKAPHIGADIITLDLEDSVPPAEKPDARQLVRENLEAVGTSGAGVYVRINNWETLLTNDDLEAVVRPGLDGVALAKCGHPDHVRRLGLDVGQRLISGSIFRLVIESSSLWQANFSNGIGSVRVDFDSADQKQLSRSYRRVA